MEELGRPSLPQFKMRSWHTFADTKQFSVPKDPKKWAERLESNILYFQANYAVVAGAVFLYYCVYNPLILFVISGALFGVVYIANNPVVRVGDQIFTQRQLMPALGAATLLLLVAVSGATVFVAVLLAILVVGTHASLYKATVVMSMRNIFAKMTGNDTAFTLAHIHVDADGAADGDSGIHLRHAAAART